ncbi:MAG: dTDP-4-dehydrorhamnose reductase [Actinomycetota bacterium]|nr:dTDP-4-dehydrorhamnose reductase [Actinomycetota bacterium]
MIGSRGQLGSDLLEALAGRAENAVLGLDLPDIDITDPQSVELVFAGFDPDVVVNCAAWTAVDLAETNEESALRVNGLGPRVLAEECRRSGAWLVQVSTDYVFDGLATTPYAEDAVPDPRSAYGRTKLAGEVAVREVLPDSHYLVRTAWLYGRNGANFVKTMARLERERDTVSVVDDQRGQPTYSLDLAEQIVRLVEARPAAGTFHGTNSGEVTWFGLAREVFALLGADPARVLPTTSAEFAMAASRPAYSVLGHDRWAEVGLPPMRPWREALEVAIAADVAGT